MPHYVVTATVQAVLEDDDAARAGQRMFYGLIQYLIDNGAERGNVRNSVVIEGIALVEKPTAGAPAGAGSID